MSGLSVYMYAHHVQVWYPQKPEKGGELSGAGVSDSWQTVKPKCDCQAL